MKKTYIQPLMKACEMDPNGLICGSDDQEPTAISLGEGDPTTEKTTLFGRTGFFGDAKGQGVFDDVW